MDISSGVGGGGGGSSGGGSGGGGGGSGGGSGGSGGSGSSRGGAEALALLGLHWGWAADAWARAARSWPRAVGGGQQHSLCLACVRVGPLMRWLALCAHSPEQRWGRVSGARGCIRERLQR